MKKVLCAVLAIFILINVTIMLCSAAETAQPEIEYFSDGSYMITEIETENSCKSTVSKSKTTKYYDSSNNLQWKATLTATFSYNGSTSSCTSSSVSHTIYDNAWRNTYSSASKSGNTATGEFTFKHYVLGIPVKTVNKTLTLTCDKNGNVS